MRQQLNEAIGAHGAWKSRLREAIERGASEVGVTAARDAARCEFGRWLLQLPRSDRDPQCFDRVRELHEAFHHEAAAVLELALQGRRDEAVLRLAPGSPFERLSVQLTHAVLDWARAA